MKAVLLSIQPQQANEMHDKVVEELIAKIKE